MSKNNRKRGFNRMKIIPLINEFTNTFNEIFKNDLNPFNLESKIRNVGDEFTLKLYPEQEKYMKEHINYIINNLEEIKNQNDKDYKVHCSMEGHVNQAFARYITSSPYGFSEQGLENKLKLLFYKANKYELTIEDYYNLKYGTNSYNEININIRKICNIKYDQNLSSNHSLDYKINTSIPIFDNPSDNNKLSELLSFRGIKYI